LNLRDTGTGVWRKRHDEELHSLCSSPNIIKAMRGAGHVTRVSVRVDSIGSGKGHEEDIREHGNEPGSFLNS
jgi:hypothetical protein